MPLVVAATSYGCCRLGLLLLPLTMTTARWMLLPWFGAFCGGCRYHGPTSMIAVAALWLLPLVVEADAGCCLWWLSWSFLPSSIHPCAHIHFLKTYPSPGAQSGKKSIGLHDPRQQWWGEMKDLNSRFKLEYFVYNHIG